MISFITSSFKAKPHCADAVFALIHIAVQTHNNAHNLNILFLISTITLVFSERKGTKKMIA